MATFRVARITLEPSISKRMRFHVHSGHCFEEVMLRSNAKVADNFALLSLPKLLIADVLFT